MLDYIQSFNAGKLTPLLDGRSDIDKYRHGCRQLKNALPLPYGPATKRGGKTYLGACASHNLSSWLLPFRFSTTTRYVLEFYDYGVRFWQDRELVGSALATPWAAADLPDIQAHQINDVVVVVHPDYSPRKLTRVTNTSWTIGEVEWDYPPLLDPNTGATTLAVYPETAGTGREMTASADTFDEDHIGAFFRIGHNRDSVAEKVAITGTNTGTAIKISGGWTVTTGGIWDATVILERASDAAFTADVETVRTYESAETKNFSDAGNEEDSAYYRLRVTNYNYHTPASGADNPYAYLESTDATVYGLVKVTDFIDAQTVEVTVIDPPDSSDATTIWSEGAWSDYRGWPRAVSTHEQRLIFAGTTHQPQTVWGSVAGDIYDFRAGTLDDSSFAYTLASRNGNRIEWLYSQDVLLIGTAGNEWSMSGGGFDDPITPTNVRVREQSSRGSARVPAVMAGDALLFVQRSAKRLREIVYSFENEKWVTPDMSQLAYDVTEPGIIQIAVAHHPETVVWCVLADGTLASMTYERDQRVVAWATHETDGLVESVAAVYGASEADEVYVTVRRTLGSGEVRRYVEVIEPDARSQTDSRAVSDFVFLDSAAKVTSESATTMFSGFDHMEGNTLGVLADGAKLPPVTVTGGQITISRAATTVVAGLLYDMLVQPMRNLPVLEDGPGFGRKTRVNRLVARVHETLGLDYGDDETGGDRGWRGFRFRGTADAMGSAPPLHTGEVETVLSGKFRGAPDYAVRARSPQPCTLVSLVPKFEVNGD